MRAIIVILTFVSINLNAQLYLEDNPVDYAEYIGKKVILKYVPSRAFDLTIDGDTSLQIKPYEPFENQSWVKSVFGNYKDLDTENKEVYNEKKKRYEEEFYRATKLYKPIVHNDRIQVDTSITGKEFSIIDIHGVNGLDRIVELEDMRPKAILRFTLQDEYGRILYWKIPALHLKRRHLHRTTQKQGNPPFELILKSH